MSIIEKLGITKTPWEINPMPTKGYTQILGKTLVCDVNKDCDVNIIAAAPEMLEALIESVIFIEDVSEGLDIGNLKHYQNKINAVEKATSLSWEEVKKLTEKQAVSE